MTARLTGRAGVVAGVLLAAAVAWTALAAGFSGTYVMGPSGVVAVTNLQANSVWRPVAVAVMCPDASTRTVTVSRVVGGMEYTISQTAGTTASYVYEFDAAYWFALSNVLRVAVQPACTGMVEVVYE